MANVSFFGGHGDGEEDVAAPVAVVPPPMANVSFFGGHGDDGEEDVAAPVAAAPPPMAMTAMSPSDPMPDLPPSGHAAQSQANLAPTPDSNIPNP